MTDLQAEKDRGARAVRLINDPMFVEGFASVRQAIIDLWERAPIRDRDGAHELKLMLKLLSDVRAGFERAIADGKFAADELERINRRESPP